MPNVSIAIKKTFSRLDYAVKRITRFIDFHVIRLILVLESNPVVSFAKIHLSFHHFYHTNFLWHVKVNLVCLRHSGSSSIYYSLFFSPFSFLTQSLSYSYLFFSCSLKYSWPFRNLDGTLPRFDLLKHMLSLSSTKH